MKNKLILLLFMLLTVLLVGSYIYVISRPQEIIPQITNERILNYVKPESAPTEECDASHDLGYYSYEEEEWTRNNKFGLYIYAENRDYFEIAQKLVNSNGGDWGYVLIPYNVKDRDSERWSRVFEQLANKHLIPIIQLWDVDVDDYEDQTDGAAKFLNRYIWPIKPRYISVYNEMNDAKFWYGNVAPAEYAEILDYTIDTFKEENENFFMMNGALNVSAPTNSSHQDAFEYMYDMNQAVPDIFNKLDGWASHPYPQPNFSGGPYALGRWGIRAYINELAYLKDTLGVEKDLPVFITETGWAHAEGVNYAPSYLSVDTISEYIRLAFEDIWLKDDRVRAVTPFTIKYEPPFDHFSWISQDNVPYKHYDVVKSIKKVKGNPPRIEKGSTNILKCNEF